MRETSVDDTSASSSAASTTTAATRMRRHRERRREGLRCLTIELRETEVDTLVKKGLLKLETRNQRNALLLAFYAFLDSALRP